MDGNGISNVFVEFGRHFFNILLPTDVFESVVMFLFVTVGIDISNNSNSCNTCWETERQEIERKCRNTLANLHVAFTDFTLEPMEC